VRLGDVVQGVAGAPVRGLADFYRSVWRRGAAGAFVPLTIAREGKLQDVTVHSVDRSALLKKPPLQ
jgi:S1-C subfamily serine protease